MRVAMLSYRGKPTCGGQGVYVRHLSRALADQGHQVEVFSGQPYPELSGSATLTTVPSYDLYGDRGWRSVLDRRGIHSVGDVAELATTVTGGFGEPLAFSLRAARLLADRRSEFDVVHDNQSLGYGLLALPMVGLPVLATLHHPITRDRRYAIAEASSMPKRLGAWRWHGFVGMQARVARRLPLLVTVSGASATDIRADFGVEPDRLRTVPLGVDTDIFRPGPRPRTPHRIVAVTSADAPLKGVRYLLEAVAKLRTERRVELVLASDPRPDGPTERRIRELGIGDSVRVVRHLPSSGIAELLRSAAVACVPSLYEGFSLPAVEAMACATPLVATWAGALPEVVGPDGECARLVPTADSDALVWALRELLDAPSAAATLGAAGLRRARARYSWERVAQATAECYAEIAGRHRAEMGGGRAHG